MALGVSRMNAPPDLAEEEPPGARRRVGKTFYTEPTFPTGVIV